MDAKIQAVLDQYHQRIEQEEADTGHSPGTSVGLEWRDRVLLAVGPETGRLINIIARSLKAPAILELGTSYGYSTIWLAEAARAAGGRVITAELADYKTAYARDMAQKAGLANLIDFRTGDALEIIAALPGKFDFVLMDLWKDMYVPCLNAILPRLNPGAVIVADNIISPGGPNVKAYEAAIRATPQLRSILLPVGAGLEISVFEG